MLPPDDPAAHLAWRIHKVDYDNPGATHEVWYAKLEKVVAHARTAKINREIPELISSLFRRVIALGHAGRNIVWVIEVLRAGWPNFLFSWDLLQPLKAPGNSGMVGDITILMI